MKAVICTEYGPPEVLKLTEVEKPAPRDHEVLIKVHAAAVTSGDCRCRGFTIPAHFSILTRLAMRLVLGITRPRKPIPGMVLAGEVETAGRRVTRFRAGDHVFGDTGMRFGAYAEYTCLPENAVISLRPANITYEEAAAVPFGSSTALYFLRKGKIWKGQNVLIYGASGAVGTSAVQLARYFGADVTGVCSAANLDLVKSLGARTVIDYTTEDFTGREEKYDIIFDAVGKISESKCRQALAPGGTFVSVMKGHAGESTEDLVLLKELVEEGKLRPVIDRCYPLEQVVEAHRYVEQGHKKGNVILKIGHSGKP